MVIYKKRPEIKTAYNYSRRILIYTFSLKLQKKEKKKKEKQKRE